MRRAIPAQLSTTVPQELAGGRHDLLGSDLKQAFVRVSAALMRCYAAKITQNDAAGSEGSVASRIGRAKDRNHWNRQTCREVRGASVAANEQARAPRKCNQLRQRT